MKVRTVLVFVVNHQVHWKHWMPSVHHKKWRILRGAVDHCPVSENYTLKDSGPLLLPTFQCFLDEIYDCPVLAFDETVRLEKV